MSSLHTDLKPDSRTDLPGHLLRLLSLLRRPFAHVAEVIVLTQQLRREMRQRYPYMDI